MTEKTTPYCAAISFARIAAIAHQMETKIKALHPTCRVYLEAYRPSECKDKRPKIQISCFTKREAQDVRVGLLNIGMVDIGTYDIPAASSSGKAGYVSKVVGYIDIG
jgi:hypothetical protein